MRYSYFGFFLILFLLGCHTPPKNAVRYALKEYYILSPNEKQITPIPQSEIEEYARCCFHDSVGLMLNRVIDGENKIFIALSVQTNPSDFIQVMKRDTSLKILDSKEFTDRKKYFHNFLIKRGSYYLNRYLFFDITANVFIVFDYRGSIYESIKQLFDAQQSFIEKNISN